MRPANPSDVRPVPLRSKGAVRRAETSAGGLVVRGTGSGAQAALIARRDRVGRLLWSLPKGHVEPGEGTEAAAIREVEEETGIRGRILAALGSIDFWFVADGRRIHKTVHHFLLAAVSGELSDADPEVVEVAWFPLEAVQAQLAYNDERKLLDRLPELLPDAG